MSVSRRALSSALRDQHFADGPPTWRIGRGKSWERPSENLAHADRQRRQLIIKLDWHSAHSKLRLAHQLAMKLRRCGDLKRCRSGACPVCVRAAQRLCVEVGLEIDRLERRLP
jgi:hypothetical protein